MDEHTHNGILLHLTRFYTEFKPPHMIVTEQIVDLLKTQPNCMIAYDVLKKSVGSAGNTLRKLLKFQQLQKFIVAASVSSCLSTSLVHHPHTTQLIFHQIFSPPGSVPYSLSGRCTSRMENEKGRRKIDSSPPTT